MGKAKERKIAGTVADPTLPKTPVTIGGKTYNLCFDLGALAEAEAAMNEHVKKAGGSEFANLLSNLYPLNLANTRILFAAGVRKFHPEIGFDEAMALLNPANILVAATAVAMAYAAASKLDVEEENPPAPSK